VGIASSVYPQSKTPRLFKSSLFKTGDSFMDQKE
jgi:hypothetical protein